MNTGVPIMIHIQEKHKRHITDLKGYNPKSADLIETATSQYKP